MSIARDEARVGSLRLLTHLGRALAAVRERRGLLWALLLASLLQAALELALPLLLKAGIDGQLAPARGSPDSAGLWTLAGLYLGLLTLGAGLSFAVAYGLAHLGQDAVLRLRGRLWSGLLRQPVAFFDEQPVGRLVTRVTNDSAALADLFATVLATAAGDVALVLGLLGLLFYLDVPTALWLLGLAPLLVGLALWFQRASRGVYRALRTQLARLNTYLQEAASGVQLIRSFQRERIFSARLAAENRALYGTQMRLVYAFAVFRPLVDAFGTFGAAMVLWAAGGRVLEGHLSPGGLVAFLLYLRLLIMPLQDLAEKFNILQGAAAAGERLFQLLDRAPEPSGAGQAEPGRPLDLEFERVSFAYRPGQPVLQGVSFRVPAGSRVALVGPTGSGKTSVLHLLLGFYRLSPGQGSIRVGGLSLEDWDVRALRARCALVPQDLFLFSGSLRDNLGVLRAPPPERLARALAASRLEAVLARRADGLDGQVGERGAQLSQGERQLASIARALLQEADVLLLDEATASVDSATEEIVQQALAELLRGRTALVVAHRLSTVQAADAILVLHRGRLVEQGDHAGLMRAGGLYARLVRAGRLS
ncbi:MAG TPA: ABC transporter ATP-binding protein [Myxococcota bacterium]|nr:ABC transporter ATP-binding protein [Myxococcota bacterium]HRY95974.1 ABC transporter ATP-binding protein [Myxococcota bacterium]